MASQDDLDDFLARVDDVSSIIADLAGKSGQPAPASAGSSTLARDAAPANNNSLAAAPAAAARAEATGSAAADDPEAAKRHAEALARADALLAKLDARSSGPAAATPSGTVVAADRTLINRSSDGGSGGASSVPEGVTPEQAAFMSSIEQDAKERAARRREREARAEKIKEEGNAAFKAGRYADAARMYSEAIAVDNSILSLYTNRAQAYVLLNQPDKALGDCDMALRIDERCIKAYIRRGQAHRALQAFGQALEAFEKARRLSPAKQRPSVEKYIAETKTDQAVAEREAKIEASLRDENSHLKPLFSPLMEGLDVLHRSTIAADVRNHAQKLAALLKTAAPADHQALQDLARLRKGMRLLHSSAALLEYTQALPEVNADQMTRLCAPADVKLGRAVGKDEEEAILAVLECVYELCDDNAESQAALVQDKRSVGVLVRLLHHATTPAIRAAVARLLLPIGETAAGKKALAACAPPLSVFWGLVHILDSPSSVVLHRANALLALGLLATHDSGRQFFEQHWDATYPVIHKSMDATGANWTTVAGAVFALLLNMSTHAPLLERLAASVPVPWVLLAATALADERGTPRENLFGLACNLATNAKFAAGLVQHPGLWDILKLHLTNKPASAMGARLVASLCATGAEACKQAMDAGMLEVLAGLAIREREPVTCSAAVRGLCHCLQRVPEARAVLHENKALAGVLSELVASPSDKVAGNAGLLVAELGHSQAFCKLVVDSSLVAALLEQLKKDRVGVQENCAIALARLAKGEAAHLVRLRELNGIEILHARNR